MILCLMGEAAMIIVMMISDVRDYRLEDFDALATLYQRSKVDEFCFEPGWPERFPIIPLPLDEHRLRAFSDARAMVLPSESGLAGTIYWQKSRIVGLLVDPGLRGKGLGRALMAAALACMEEAITLDVVASNTPAIRLYESLGFQPAAQRKGHYHGVAVTVTTMRRHPVTVA